MKVSEFIERLEEFDGDLDVEIAVIDAGELIHLVPESFELDIEDMTAVVIHTMKE